MTIAAYCEKGHLVGVFHSPPRIREHVTFARQEHAGQRRFDRFCIECGSPVFERCPHCNSRFTRGANFCGDCGRALPWTAAALAAAAEYTKEASALTAEDQTVLTDTFPDLVHNSPKTQLALNRFSKIIAKAGPTFARALIDILKDVVTGEVKRHLGL